MSPFPHTLIGVLSPMSTSWTKDGCMEVNMSLDDSMYFYALESRIQVVDFEDEIVKSACPFSGGGIGLHILSSFSAKNF